MEKQLLLGTGRADLPWDLLGGAQVWEGWSWFCTWVTQSLLAVRWGRARGCATTVPRQLLPQQGLNDLLMHKTQQGVAPLLLQALGPFQAPPGNSGHKPSRVTPTTYFIVFYLHKQTSGLC